MWRSFANKYCVYMYRNGGVNNCTECIGSTPIPFSVGNIAPEKSRLECKVCRSTPVCMTLCHARIIYLHSTSSWMSRVCKNLSVHEYLISNGTCRESHNMAYQCLANEVMKISTAKKPVMIMTTSKKNLTDYLLKSTSNGDGHPLAGSS